MPSPPQALLQRRPGTTKEAFRTSYLRHGHLVLPWCIDVGVVYYAQIHDPCWSSPQPASRYPEIVIEEWDAAAEMAFPDGFDVGKLGGKYYENVILPDERRVLLSEAMLHLKMLEPGSVVGRRVEFIVDGKPTVAFEEWMERWEEERR